MKGMKKFSKILAIITMSVMLLPLNISGTAMGVSAESSTQLSEQDLVKVSNAINMSTDVDLDEIGKHNYQIFDRSNPEFANLFVSSNKRSEKIYSISASSREEFSSKYGETRAFGVGIEAAVPVYDVSARIDSYFDTSVKSQVKTVNEEYFEYYEYYKRTRTISTDWLSRDLSSYFSDTFIEAYNGIDSVKTAIGFLKKYGTHVFDTYVMGGSLIITNYVVSEKNIKQTYRENKKTLDLKSNVTKAISLNANAEADNIEANNVNDDSTKASMNQKSYGGKSTNSFTVQQLFTFIDSYLDGKNAGYVFSNWTRSLDDDNLKEIDTVIDAENPVAIWDLFDKSKYYDGVKDAYLKQAFDIMCYGNYADLCNKNGIDSKILGEIKYTVNNMQFSISATNGSIRLPKNVSAQFCIGESLLKNGGDAEYAEIVLDEAYSDVSLSNNLLYIGNNAEYDKTINLSVRLHGVDICNLKILVEDTPSDYMGGYGTKDQPYLISNAEHWNSIMKYNQNTTKMYYQLANDIDLKGHNFEVGGSSDRASFIGELDGNGYTLSNFSIVAKSDWGNMGLFGSNSGVIKNLTIKNAKCMNSGLISATDVEINAGILVGDNEGKIENIKITDSSIRITGALNNNAKLNVGAICGVSFGDIDSVGAAKCNIYAQSWKGQGVVSVGGIAGSVKVSRITNAYVNNSNINAYNQKSDSATYQLGGIVGYVYSSEETIAKVSYCVANDNNFNTTSGKFGYIAGESSANNSFDSCYYASMIEKSVNSKSMNGCLYMREVTLSNIGDAEFNRYWTVDSNGNVILKKHAEVK